MLGALLENFDDPTADADRGLPNIIPGSARQGFGIEKEQQIDIGRIIEFVAAELSHCDHGKTRWVGVRRVDHEFFATPTRPVAFSFHDAGTAGMSSKR